MSRTVSVISGLLILLISTAPSLADQRHLLMGTWTLDLSKLAIPNPPQSVTIVLSAAGGGRYKMSVDIVDNDGGTRQGASTFKADGTPSPAVGNADYDVVSMTMPSRRIMVMGGGFKGHPSNTRVFSLSDDGKHMIETVVGHGSDGTPTTRVDVWNRQ
ncbi:MAG TPA: hypothetical protein VIY90_00360 [Steroidobacteraceae bacterium]